MRKIGIAVVLMGLSMIISGCTKTWSGVKQDSSKAWYKSKKAVHNATQ
ncbi:entericidin EcnAB [Sulfurovum sp.]|nr:entericidin EcnAB [Sulfurovum sp.]